MAPLTMLDSANNALLGMQIYTHKLKSEEEDGWACV